MLITLVSERNEGSNFTINSTSSKQLNKGEYEVALISGMVCYGWDNISAELGNNILKYRISNVAAWITVTIPDGIYNWFDLDAYLKGIMKVAGHYDPGANTATTATSDDIYYINIGINTTNGKYKIEISNGYQLDLSVSKINETIGFASGILASDGTFESTNIPDMNRGVSQVQLRCDLVASQASFTNGVSAPVLYGFNPTVKPWEFIKIQPMSPIYLPMSKSDINSINIKITDQNGRILPVGPERTTVLIDIRRAR